MPKIKGLAKFGVWWEPLSRCADRHLLAVSSSHGSASSPGPSPKDSNPIVGALASRPHQNLLTFQRIHLQMPSLQGLGFHIWILVGYKNSDHSNSSCLMIVPVDPETPTDIHSSFLDIQSYTSVMHLYILTLKPLHLLWLHCGYLELQRETYS